MFNLSRSPQTCVRFDRHAVYLGVPSSRERCPAHAAGRTEAILLAPVGATTAAGGSRTLPLGGLTSSFVTHGLDVTATWSGDPGVVAAAFGRSSLPTAHATPVYARSAATARAAQSGQTIYTGLGFDTCTAPSTAQMSAWLSSKYRAVAVYVGGENKACLQPNLTPSWVRAEIAAGWHLIPTYVGLQAPSNECGCAAINPSKASAEGTADASSAVRNAESLGIPSGTAIYSDMEQYNDGSNNSAVLAYLSGWTTELHAAGYASGVYSSASSGITELVTKWGTSYPEPDDIWVADWNGVQSTSSVYVPAADWGENQRIHQYEGSHYESHGGATIEIDGDYMDVSLEGQLLPPPPAPSLSVSPAVTGITNLTPSWPRETGIAYWRVLAGASSSPGSLTPIGTWSGTVGQIPLHGTASDFEVEALGAAGQLLGTSPVVPTPAHLAVIGKSAFVSAASGVGSLPGGCYVGAACGVVTTIHAGLVQIARTGSEPFRSNSANLIKFELTARGRRMLLRAPGGRLAVTVRMRDGSAGVVSANLTLIAFASGSIVHTRRLDQGPAIRFAGLSEFVSSEGEVGVLAGCGTTAPCRITTTVSVGRTIVSSPHAGVVGAHELGYLSLSLTPQGRAMLEKAGGTLAAHVELEDDGDPTSATVALIAYGGAL